MCSFMEVYSGSARWAWQQTIDDNNKNNDNNNDNNDNNDNNSNNSNRWYTVTDIVGIYVFGFVAVIYNKIL